MRKLLTNWKFVFGLGLLVVLAATTIETLRGRATNFYAYYDATNMFWAGINPYTLEYVEAHKHLVSVYTCVYYHLRTCFPVARVAGAVCVECV